MASYWSKSAKYSLPVVFTATWGRKPITFRTDLYVSQNYNDAAIRLTRKFYDCFSRFDTIPACDRQTDRQTDGHRTTAITRETLNVPRLKNTPLYITPTTAICKALRYLSFGEAIVSVTVILQPRTDGIHILLSPVHVNVAVKTSQCCR